MLKTQDSIKNFNKCYTGLVVMFFMCSCSNTVKVCDSNWFVGNWSNRGNSDYRELLNIEYTDEGNLLFSKGLGKKKQDVRELYPERETYQECSDNHLYLFFVGQSDTMYFKFDLIEAFDGRNAVQWDLKLDTVRSGYFSKDISSVLFKSF